jgi:CRISPR-associated endonuclease/helicase Cas3
VSFGLVRVANIGVAIDTARALAQRFPEAWVACYHARDFRIQRHLKEQRLDFLLNRKRGDGHIANDPEIRALLAASPAADVPFIVVATPVEEIGRDHDFDWGVIEPSSAHSIVQTAGRINRHRLRQVSQPNIAILQHNRRWLNSEPGKPCFIWPGLESRTSSHRYTSPDLRVLLAEDDLDALDARLRLGDGVMARNEDQITRHRLAEPLDVLEANDNFPAEWMTQAFYTAHTLRDGMPQQAWRAVQDNGFWVFQRQTRPDKEEPWLTRHLGAQTPPAKNSWLNWDLDALAAACVERDIAVADGLQLQAPYRDEQAKLCWDESFGFDWQ